MTARPRQSWTAIAREVSRRISDGDWPAGALIPNEADLAQEFGCARATVSRALRELADQGLLDRRRRAGTRVRELPERRARLDIPVMRQQVERRGARYGYLLLLREVLPPPSPVAATLALPQQVPALHLRALHNADEAPFLLEDRWINLRAVPDAETADFARENANEWLLRNVPLTTGELGLTACAAAPEEAELLNCAPGDALFQQDRITINDGERVTWVRSLYAPGYRMRLAL
ncbi:UTRA domain-containing protein [Aquicoccus sp. SCR17]|nr:UTRA domain-containing protein [Carideicomes alvinocaridis]